MDAFSYMSDETGSLFIYMDSIAAFRLVHDGLPKVRVPSCNALI